MTRKTKPNGDLFLPELVAQTPGPWSITEVDIRDSAVSLTTREARVPRAYTTAQRLARLHELGHVKYTPPDWGPVVGQVLALGASRGDILDPAAVVRLLRMLEENRIDWLLWDAHGIDLRPSREVLDWSKMSVPSDPLMAMHWVLQLAWTVWASRGLGRDIPNPPPERETDPDTGRFFDECWTVVANYDPDLCLAVVRGCLSMYREPTTEQQVKVAAELATFFPPPPPPPEPAPPEEKQEEKEKQEEARKEEEAKEDERKEEASGVGSEVVTEGHYQVHDHTAGVRRPSVRIARRDTPQPFGTRLAFPHRYMLDRSVFARRTLTEGSVMIDGSGSMTWKQEDMEALLEAMPAIWIGIYSGVQQIPGVYGRICILAKNGRFSVFEGLEKERSFNNAVDLEALELLSRWPRPRFWLSDGLVCGGKHHGPHSDPALKGLSYMQMSGRIFEGANRLMRRHDILRVRRKEDMHDLFARKRVTLYRDCVNRQHFIEREREAVLANYYPPDWQEAPISYQL